MAGITTTHGPDQAVHRTPAARLAGDPRILLNGIVLAMAACGSPQDVAVIATPPLKVCPDEAIVPPACNRPAIELPFPGPAGATCASHDDCTSDELCSVNKDGHAPKLSAILLNEPPGSLTAWISVWSNDRPRP